MNYFIIVALAIIRELFCTLSTKQLAQLVNSLYLHKANKSDIDLRDIYNYLPAKGLSNVDNRGQSSK